VEDAEQDVVGERAEAVHTGVVLRGLAGELAATEARFHWFGRWRGKACEVLLCVASATNSFCVAEGKMAHVLECMHAKENKIDDIGQMQHLLKLKKVYKSQPNIKIKF
jgi:hypothetical protein